MKEIKKVNCCDSEMMKNGYKYKKAIQDGLTGKPVEIKPDNSKSGTKEQLEYQSKIGKG